MRAYSIIHLLVRRVLISDSFVSCSCSLSLWPINDDNIWPIGDANI